MFVLGIQGSPRKNGNTRWLLESFLKECGQYGATTRTIDACKASIIPCMELIVCEKKGYCPLKDDMEKSIYPLIKKADIVVLASPVFFYSVSAQIKILIDRCQMFWGRKYKLKLKDPMSYSRQGFLLSVAASGGKKVFDGVHLTARYFFDAISAEFQGALTYRHIEDATGIRSHPTVKEDIKKAAGNLCKPLLKKKILMFVSKHDACMSQIAAAFARIHSKGKLTVITGGYDPHPRILPELIPIMEGKGIDFKYQRPTQIETVKPVRTPDMVINLDSGKNPVNISALEYQNWEIKRPSDTSVESLNRLINELESKTVSLVNSIC